MTRRTHRTLLCTLGALALGLAVAGTAWACTPLAKIYLSAKSLPEEGATLTVTGKGFADGAPVQVQLDSGGTLATATGPEFKVDVKIPKTAPGTHYVTALVNRPDGLPPWKAARALEVKSSAAASQSNPVPSSEPALTPARERARSTPARSPAPERGVAPAASEPAASQAPTENAASPASAPLLAENPANAESPAKAKAPSAPAPPAAKGLPAIAPLTPSLPNPWSNEPPAGPGRDGVRAGAKPSGGIPSPVVVALLILGLAMCGAGSALLRARPRPTASEATSTEPPRSDLEHPPPSLEEELDELVAQGAVLPQADSPDSEQPAPRELVGAGR